MNGKAEGGLQESLFRVARALCGAPQSAVEVVAEALRTSGEADRVAAFRALRRAVAKRDETPENADLRALPPSERDALALRVFGGLRGADLAAVLGTSDAETQRRLFSATTRGAIDANPTTVPSPTCIADRGAWLQSADLSDHGVDCDGCRDFRHEAQARLSDLEAREPHEPGGTIAEEYRQTWREALEAHARAAAASSEAVTSEEHAPIAATGAGMGSAADVAAAGIPAPSPAPSPTDTAPEGPLRQEPAAPLSPARRPFRLSRAAGIAALGGVVLVGGGLLTASAWKSHRATVASSVFHIDAVGPAAENVKRTGLVNGSLAANTDLRDGTVTTDARGFVRFSQGEGRYLLDRASTVTFGGDSVQLTDGSLLLRDDKAFQVHAGAASVRGEGEVQLTVLPDRTHVRVLRGFADVEFQGRKDRVEVGQEGLLRDGRLEVASASGPSLRLAESKEAEAERPLVGLGELIARKPGSKEERDGAVVLRKHSVKTRIAGAMARTEIEEEFENKTDDVLEGVVRFPLPPGAVLERLALEVDGKLVEGEFVERKRAAAIFRGAIQTAVAKPLQQEEIIWVPGPWRDPALLEWQRGGRFELRIFPIAKRSVRRVVMAYTETVPLVAGERQYSYPMPRGRNLKVPSFSADVKVVGYDDKKKPRVRGYDLAERAPGQYDAHYESFEPNGDLTVSYETPDQKAQVAGVAFAGDRDGQRERWVSLSLRPNLPHVKDPSSRDQVLVVDVGRGMYGERFERAKKLVAETIGNMDRRDRVTVLACDTTCKQLRAGFVPPGIAAVNDVASFLGDVKTDGASDMAAAALAGARVAGHEQSRPLRVTLLSAGAATAGYREPNRLARLVSEQVGEKAQIATVAVTPDADAAALEAVARAGGGVFVTYAPGRLAGEVARDILDASYGSTLRNVELVLPEGLSDVAPAKLASVRGGTETLVAAKMLRDDVSGDVVLRGTVGGTPFEQKYPLKLVATASEDRAFVPRLYASLRIKDVSGDRAHEQEVVKLSKQERVPAPQTSLLVLESETMFKAFGIDRTKQGYAWDTDRAADASLAVAAGEAAPEDLAKDKAAEGKASGGAGGLLDRHDGYSTEGLGGGSSSSRGYAEPPAAAAPATPAPPAKKAAPSRDESSGDAMDPFAERRPEPRRPSPPPPPRGRWMRRTWQRHATIQDGAGTLFPSEKELSDARRAVDVAPDARANYIKLARLLARRDEDAELRTLLGRWEQKDPFDLGLLGQRSEYLLRRGDRSEALRVQAGALAAPSLTGDAAAQTASSLARAYERSAQDAEACSFWRTAFEIKPQDDEAAARAMQCDRRGGLHIAEEALRAGARDFGKVERLASSTANASTDDTNLAGDFRIDARWDVSQDLDIALVLPSGERVTWATRGARARNVASTHEESLAYSKWFAGGALVEVGPGAGGVPTRTVRGTLTIRALGQVREIPFVVDGIARPVARVNVSVEEVLVPSDAPPPNFTNWGRQNVVF